MQDQNSSNQVTVPWQKGVVIDQQGRPEYAAKQSDIDIYQKDGVVLLRGVFADWVGRLRAGLQRNLDDPQSYAFPCDSNPKGKRGSFFDSYCN